MFWTPFKLKQNFEKIYNSNKNKKKLLNNCTEIDFRKLISFLKNINTKGKLTKSIKKYLPHTTCMKCISEDRYFAIPSMKGNNSQPDILRIYANINFI